MARKITTKVPLAEIYFDEDFYPRTQPSWQTAYIYSQNMLSGSKFPPITLALFKGKKYLVDGKHRYEAYKLLKKKNILAETFTGWDKRKIYEEAVRRNMAHGQTLSPYEKRIIILKLRSMKYSNTNISKLIGVPQDRITKFIGQRLVSSTTGEIIVDTILKSSLKHKAGGQYTSEEIQSMKEVSGKTSYHGQLDLFKQLIELFEKDLVDLDNEKIRSLLLVLKQYINNVK